MPDAGDAMPDAGARSRRPSVAGRRWARLPDRECEGRRGGWGERRSRRVAVVVAVKLQPGDVYACILLLVRTSSCT